MFRLKEVRKAANMSQQQLAALLGVTQATLSGWENEKYEIDNGSLNKCAEIFNVSTDYLLGNMLDTVEIKKARETVKQLCEEQNIPITIIENTLGTNYATFKCWCNGYGDFFNNANGLTKLADLFNVSVDYILGRTDETGTKSLDEQLEGIDFALYGETKDLDDAQKQDVLRFIRFLKNKDEG